MTIQCQRVANTNNFNVTIQYQGASHAFQNVPAAQLKKIGLALADLIPQNNQDRATILTWLNGIQ